MSERLRVLFGDHLSLARGKYLQMPSKKSASVGETRFCQGVYALTYDKALLPAPGGKLLDGLPDMVARYETAAIRRGWRHNERVAVCDLYDADGEALGVCGRGALKRAVAAWQQHGLTAQVGVELEGYAFVRGEDGNWTPYDTPGAFVYGTGAFIDPRAFTDAIWQRAAQCGFNLEMITAEFDSPQFEFTLRYDNALAAADDVLLFRLMAREVALEHEVLLTFMPKPIAALSGSGVHVNFSFVDANGDNIIGDEGATDRLSAPARACVAGLMHHHRALAGLLAPTVNSYRRLQPASLSGYWRNWGADHRGVTTRITSETGEHARIEHRMADAGANPHLAIAAVLQAARLGVQHNYALPPAETADCLESHDAEDGVPDNLAIALDELQGDAVLVEAVGAELVDNLAAIKRAEIEHTAQMNDEQLRDYYIFQI